MGQMDLLEIIYSRLEYLLNLRENVVTYIKMILLSWPALMMLFSLKIDLNPTLLAPEKNIGDDPLR